jgi:hypothetical protein
VSRRHKQDKHDNKKGCLGGHGYLSIPGRIQKLMLKQISAPMFYGNITNKLEANPSYYLAKNQQRLSIHCIQQKRDNSLTNPIHFK